MPQVFGGEQCGEIGVLTVKLCIFLSKWVIVGVFGTTKNMERLLRGLDVIWPFLLLVLMPPKSGFLLDFAP